jgi:DNA-directed RNA polymerase specialized sigma24 family protein
MHTPPIAYANIDGHELFRRAIVDGDQIAWAEGVARYRGLLVSWAARCAASAAIGEPGDDIADHAFSRAWAALLPERFDQFPNLAAVLAYLRACVTTAVIDCARSQHSAERLSQVIEVGGVATPEEISLAGCDRQALWEIVDGLIQNEQERAILIESFVYGQPPRAILARYPQLFANVGEIYNAKRNLFERLKRCAELREIYQER